MAEVLTCRSGVDGRVAEVVLHRPARRNALTPDSIRELREALDSALGEPGTGAILLRGAGACFCSGIDLDQFPREPADARRWSTSWAQVHGALAGAEVPVVVALERAAVNAGAALALAADLLVVGQGAFLQVQEVVRGMVPWANVAWLAARFGPARALDLTLTGRRLDGPEMRRLGIAHEVVADSDVTARARELATVVAEHPRAAVAATKALVRDLTGLSAPAALDAAFRAAEGTASIGRRSNGRR